MFCRYEELVEDRKKRLNDLLAKQNKFCKNLGVSPKELPNVSLPSEADLRQLNDYIEELESEYFCRSEKYVDMKQKILDTVYLLKYKPISEFEKAVCDDNNEGTN